MPRGTGGDHGETGGLREAILGLLSIRPMSGYDVRRSYERALQRIWYAPIGQVYPTLRRMERQGLLESEIHVQTSRPNRKIYRLTAAAGHAALMEWLSRPAELPRMHHDFIHRLFLMHHMPPENRRAFIRNYARRCREWERQLEEVDAKMRPALEGPYQESVSVQLMALGHLRRLAQAEAESAMALEAAVERNGTVRRSKGRTPSVDRPTIHGDLALQ